MKTPLTPLAAALAALLPLAAVAGTPPAASTDRPAVPLTGHDIYVWTAEPWRAAPAWLVEAQRQEQPAGTMAAGEGWRAPLMLVPPAQLEGTGGSGLPQGADAVLPPWLPEGLDARLETTPAQPYLLWSEKAQP